MTRLQKDPMGISIYFFYVQFFKSINSVGPYFYVAPQRQTLKVNQMSPL